MKIRINRLIILLAMISCLPAVAQEEEDGIFEISEISFEFKGKKSFEEETIRGIMGLKEGDIYNRETFNRDVERLKRFYFDNGYFDMHLDSEVRLDTNSSEAYEKYIITEGARYKIHDIKYKGLDSVSQSSMGLIENVRDKKVFIGGYYSKDTVRQEIVRIVNVLQNNGYALAIAENPEVLKFESNIKSLENKVNIVFSFKPGEVYYFGKTTITLKGKTYNVTTEDIRRELTYKEGEMYDKEKIVQSEINLSKMSILENPRIGFQNVDSASRIIDLGLNIFMSNKYEVTPEIFSYYFGNLFYIGAGITFSDKNFLGGGRVLSSSLKSYFNSTENYRLEWINSLYQPFLFGNKNTIGSWNVGLKYISEEIASTSTISNLFSISHELPTYTYLNRIIGSWSTDYDNVTLKEDISSGDTLIIRSFSFNVFNSNLALTLVHNNVNNVQFPFKGNFQSYEFEDSGLMSGLFRQFVNSYIPSYFKFTNITSFYFNLSNRDFNVPSALATKFLLGSIFEYGDNTFEFNGQELSGDRVPSDEKFVCGGSSSVRGWGARQLGIVPDKDIGGNFILESSVEHRVRPFMGAENIYFRDIGFATFIDVGNVWTEIQKFRVDEIAVAAGAGLRYYTIVGAIRFDIGLKIYDPQPGTVGGSKWLFGEGANFNDKYNFQFGIGNTF